MALVTPIGTLPPANMILFMVIQRCCIQAAASGTGVRSLVRKISNVCKSAVKVGGMGLSRVGVSSGTKAL